MANLEPESDGLETFRAAVRSARRVADLESLSTNLRFSAGLGSAWNLTMSPRFGSWFCEDQELVRNSSSLLVDALRYPSVIHSSRASVHAADDVDDVLSGSGGPELDLVHCGASVDASFDGGGVEQLEKLGVFGKAFSLVLEAVVGCEVRAMPCFLSFTKLCGVFSISLALRCSSFAIQC